MRGCVSVRVCATACVRACVSVPARACVSVSMRVGACVCASFIVHVRESVRERALAFVRERA